LRNQLTFGFSQNFESYYLKHHPTDDFSKMFSKSKSYVTIGTDPRECDWGDRRPKTYGSNFIHHDFVQFGKRHSRYKVILPSIVLSQQCCEVYFISLAMVKV